MTDGLAAQWFFDVVSPFSYLHLRQFRQLQSRSASPRATVQPTADSETPGGSRRESFTGREDLRLHLCQGRDPELDWRGMCEVLSVAEADALIADSAVKQQLIANTEQAGDAGVFGVPTFVVRGQLFWGSDTIAWMNAFVDDPGMFERGEMSRALQIEFGAHREI